jgi:DNA-binding beta-propeller fold protein YncE
MRFRLFPVLLLLGAFACASDLRQIAMVDVPGRPGFDAITFTNGKLLIAHQGSNTVDIFDTVKRRIIATVKDLDGPHGVVASDKTGRAYIANSGGDTITVLSTKDWQPQEEIQLNDSPYALALSADGRLLYSANWQDRSITAIDLAHGNRQSTVSVEGTPAALLFEPTRGLLYASLQDQNQVLVLDPSLREVKRLKLEASQPTGLAADTTGRHLFVAVRFAVLQLDAESGQEMGRVPAPGGVDELSYDPDSGNVYAASEGFVTIVRTNGGFRALDEVKTDVKGHTLAYDSNKGYVYLPGGHEGKAKLLILKNVHTQVPQGEQVAEKK